ncbi:MAG TPA: rod shape-determining protein MreC [Bacteroidia bacterium]|nr:rod shape-determining protein MreC [Bacteroidia bacterium]
MSGIIAFLRRFYFFVLFIILEIISLAFVFTNNYYHQAGFFNSSNRITGTVYTAYSGVTSYFNLKNINHQLAEENIHLLNLASEIKDTSTHKKLPKTNPFGQQFNFILAEVIDNSTNLPNNYITLNAGTEQGIGEGMGVISPSGIAGIVTKASSHYSVVMSLLHKKALVSAMFKKSGTFGTLAWGDKMDYRFATLTQIPMSEKVKIGDTIVTSGYSNVFPKGIMVGVVDDFKSIPELYFYVVHVKLSIDFKNIKYVYVVSDLKKIEKTELETNAENSLNEKVK